MSHWANDYIGIPWEKGAQGPDSYDCWAFVRMVQERHFGRVLPAIYVDALNLREVTRNFKQHAEREHWALLSESEPRQDGDAVLMAHSSSPSHVGVFLTNDGGGVLHCVRGIGVIYSNMVNLHNAGWGHLEFYRYKI